MANPNPNPGGYAGEAPPDDSGMSVEDAATSAYDDHDRAENGIAEGEREPMEKWLKYNADYAGTTVRDGLVNLVDTASVLRNGSQAEKRAMLGHVIDEHQISPEPTAEAAPQYVATGDPDMGLPSRPILDPQQANDAVADFVQANPVAGDPAIQQAMIEVAEDMQRKGHAPHLGTMISVAVQADPRFNERVKRDQEDAQVEKAKAASVQVSGGGNSTSAAGKSADVGDILDELVPR